MVDVLYTRCAVRLGGILCACRRRVLDMRVRRWWVIGREYIGRGLLPRWMRVRECPDGWSYRLSAQLGVGVLRHVARDVHGLKSVQAVRFRVGVGDAVFVDCLS